MATVDMHFHVGLLGEEWPHLGGISERMQREAAFKVFLLYAGLDKHVTDAKLKEAALATIAETKVDQVVCLALAPYHDPNGREQRERSHMWVANEYIRTLRDELEEKILFGASIHPYDPDFTECVREVVDQGAVLLKWLPSAQGINLADDRVRNALALLATAGPRGTPLPVLLHTGPEHAVLPVRKKHRSFDYLRWTFLDRVRNVFTRFHVPNVTRIRQNLEHALDHGAVIIFAHCGLPYFGTGPLGPLYEHSDFKAVKRLLRAYPATGEKGGRCYADVSACCTPFRKTFFDDIKALPEDCLLFGSDFPTPVFELHADLAEAVRDFKAILRGDLERIIVPQGNLVDVNRDVLAHFFGEHPLFTNFSRQLL